MKALKVDFKPLNQTDRIHLNAASGWIELKNYPEARTELEQISLEMKTHPAVLLTWCDLYFAAEKWEFVLSLTETLVQQIPKLNQPWIRRSFALHELKRTQDAFDLLVPAAAMFPELWVIKYNLACYSSRLVCLKEAMEWLEKAIDYAGKEDIRQMALDDLDLEPLWMTIGEI